RPAGRAAVVWWALAVLCLLAVIGGLVLVRSQRVAAERRGREETVKAGPRVLVMPVRHGPTQREIELPATVHGYVETSIYAKVAGYLKTINVDKGDRVRQGELLAVIDAPELDKQVADMAADYAIKQVTNRRSQTVAKTGALSKEEADVASADMAKSKATLGQFRALQAYERITAPVDGLVTARFVDPGALIPQATAASSTDTPILSIATLQPVRVYADVPQDVTPYIADGDPAIVTVTQYPKRQFSGTVTRHPNALAATTRTMLVEVDLPNTDSALLPGMYGTLRMQVPERDVARVADDALVFRDGKVYVPTVRDDRLHLAEVALGFDDGRSVEILEGLSDDDVVALNVGQGVQEGDAVQPVRAQSAQGQAVTTAPGPASTPAAPAS
ncbi:MAG TPA: efflux RND transporter periplasmic adaptor subunit, partial [Caldimonas sp.]|nr:efflux RND transporter periplasmic adaptor subunit [Caldimonas sp.]